MTPLTPVFGRAEASLDWAPTHHVEVLVAGEKDLGNGVLVCVCGGVAVSWRKAQKITIPTAMTLAFNDSPWAECGLYRVWNKPQYPESECRT